MPRASKTCSEPGCPRLAGECLEHRRVPWEGSTRRQRLPKGWHRIQARVLRRDPICRICGAAPSTAVDHERPGGSDSEWNLRGVCDTCHNTKSGREGAAARNALR